MAVLADSACTVEWINRKQASFVIPSVEVNMGVLMERSGVRLYQPRR